MINTTMPRETVPNRLGRCERCGQGFLPYERRRRSQRFCGDSCRREAWEATTACGVSKLPQAPELKRQAAAKALILGRLQDGPALAAELVACGGGYRYSARIRELRQAGHNITTENLGDGVWRYTLVLP